jgi:hypothetical protein
MILESKINRPDDLFETNGIQALINELERIKDFPHKQHLLAVKTCAMHLAKAQVIERFDKIRGIYYNYDKKLWYSEKRIKGKIIFISHSSDRDKVIRDYVAFCKKNSVSL